MRLRHVRAGREVGGRLGRDILRSCHRSRNGLHRSRAVRPPRSSATGAAHHATLRRSSDLLPWCLLSAGGAAGRVPATHPRRAREGSRLSRKSEPPSSRAGGPHAVFVQPVGAGPRRPRSAPRHLRAIDMPEPLGMMAESDSGALSIGQRKRGGRVMRPRPSTRRRSGTRPHARVDLLGVVVMTPLVGIGCCS